MQVILDSSFARPGSAPIWGGKKGEFRDWTRQLVIIPFVRLFFQQQVIGGTAISYGAKINANFAVSIIGEIPKG